MTIWLCVPSGLWHRSSTLSLHSRSCQGPGTSQQAFLRGLAGARPHLATEALACRTSLTEDTQVAKTVKMWHHRHRLQVSPHRPVTITDDQSDLLAVHHPEMDTETGKCPSSLHLREREKHITVPQEGGCRTLAREHQTRDAIRDAGGDRATGEAYV